MISENKEYDKKCDVYSYGLTAWSIDVEQLPFPDAKSEVDLLKIHIREERPPLNPRCKMNSIIQKCWQANSLKDLILTK